MLRLARPFIAEAAIAEVAEVLRSGNLVQGDQVARFEAALGEYLGVKHAIAVSSGTAALHVALLALGIGPGDEVVVPAFTYPATANVVELCGARTILVDIGLDDYCLDTSLLEAAVTRKTRAVIPVHEFGQAADMNGVLDFAQRHGLHVIEDAACALGTEYHGRKAGTLGEIGCFSFHPRKALTTGEGGAVTTNDDRLADIVRSLRSHGFEATDTGRREFVRAGLNYRMTEFQAVLGRHQLLALDEELNLRRQQAHRYDSLLSGARDLKTPARFPERRPVFQTYHVLLPGAIDRDTVIQQLKARDVETNLGAHALNCLPYYRDRYGAAPESFPAATRAYRSGLALPIGRHCELADQQRVAAALTEVLAS